MLKRRADDVGRDSAHKSIPIGNGQQVRRPAGAYADFQQNELNITQRTDWLPYTRTSQLNMAKNWLTILNTPGTGTGPGKADGGSPPPPADRWGVSGDAVNDLANLTAEQALTTAKSEETRTPVATAACKTAFDALTAVMRGIKKRYFYVPPLTEADLVALGLKIPDRTHTAEVTIETYLVGRHQLGIRCIYLTGSPTGPANKGYRVYYKVVAQGETPPANPGELSKSFFTKRKKDVIDFEFTDSGKNAYFAVQVENEGKKGP